MVRMKKNRAVSSLVWVFLRTVILLFFVCVMLYPFLWMISGTFKTAGELMQVPPTLIPHMPTLDNYREVFKKIDILGRMYWNSLFVGLVIPVVQTVVCLPAAYAFANLRFRGKKIVFLAFMGSMMLPVQLTIIQNYVTMSRLKLINNPGSLILLGTFGAMCIFMMRQFFLTLPRELDEAARIDGCGIFRSFVRIAIPLAKPIISTNIILCFNAAWGDFYTPMLFLKRLEVMTLPVGMTVLSGAYNTQSPAVMVTAMTVSIIPVVIVYLLFRRQLIAGIATTGIKV